MEYNVIGLMSGTSLDGLDLVNCLIKETQAKWGYEILHTKSIPYDIAFQKTLKDAIHLPAINLLQFHHEYGRWLGKQIKEFTKENNIKANLVASHGHTIHHQPQNGFTFQLGYGQDIANISGLKTVADFRSADIASGGQGAPLVPIGDELFFGAYDFCLNLGGISNISYKKDGERYAYDIGLANMVLNHIIQKTGKAYDENGSLAASGTVNNQLLDKLNKLQYYQEKPPKSTGYEWFLEEVIPIVSGTTDSTKNMLCTAVHHICNAVSNDIKELSEKPKNSVLITGGGAFNNFLIQTLKQQLGPDFQVDTSNTQLIEFKEALVFGLMGVLRINNLPNCLSSVTGATSDVTGGVIFNPN
ncbi:anhydro-N-acetylmuramic acid kinase [Spongiivirga sp. MCCC 1A20706]|uniref:anhydro-N-acetylmuramic acid kinase n=1 Tax=Spongiivirga sp. MCCC 1A20706 TaxID=3160963 RepID=UPI0039776F2E